MSELVNKNSRNSSSVQIANGVTYPVWVGGDFFYVLSASGTLTVSVNGGPFTPLQVGLIHSGVVGRDDIGEIKFANASGAAIDLVVIFGKGKMEITGQTTLLPGGSVALTPATIAALNPVALDAASLTSITPAAVAHTADLVDVNAASTAFAAKKSIQVWNTGAVDITVNFGPGARTLAPGEDTGPISCFRLQDALPTVTVDTTGGGGGSAKVMWLA